MKKKLFLLLVLVYGAVSSYANSLTIKNSTTATYNLTIQTYSLGSNYCTANISIPPGTTFYSSPSAIADLFGCALTTDDFVALWGFCSPYDIAIFSPNYSSYPGAYTQNIGVNNACNPGYPVTFTWTINTSIGDALIEIS